jgi:hypothetical protein
MFNCFHGVFDFLISGTKKTGASDNSMSVG